MMAIPFRRYTHMKIINQTACAIHNSNVGHIIAGRTYSKDKGSCCKEVSQTEGRRVEPWPKTEPSPPAWRAECLKDAQPPNYDPYRIKVPDVVVPPLPPSNAKPMLDCARTKGPCSLRPVPDPPPCPPPPPKPFPWMYVFAVASFLATMGVIYKVYLWREEKEKLGENKPIWQPRRKTRYPHSEKDLPACVQYLIVGAGAAGWAAYRAIMEHDNKAKVLVAIGAEPRTELAEVSFLEQDHVNGGFLVNTELQARTHLYVAGDAASLYSQWREQRVRMEHHGAAEEQGCVAGANMTGYWIPCNMEPHYALTLGDQLEMEVVGEVGACLPTVGLFKQCGLEEDPGNPKVAENAISDKPCYKKSEEYQKRYKRGILFYLRDEVVVGIVFWNIPPIEDRKQVATELIRARPSYKDINLLAELVGFPGTKCFYRSTEELQESEPPCIQKLIAL